MLGAVQHVKLVQLRDTRHRLQRVIAYNAYSNKFGFYTRRPPLGPLLLQDNSKSCVQGEKEDVCYGIPQAAASVYESDHHALAHACCLLLQGLSKSCLLLQDRTFQQLCAAALLRVGVHYCRTFPRKPFRGKVRQHSFGLWNAFKKLCVSSLLLKDL